MLNISVNVACCFVCSLLFSAFSDSIFFLVFSKILLRFSENKSEDVLSSLDFLFICLLSVFSLSFCVAVFKFSLSKLLNSSNSLSFSDKSELSSF